MQLVRIKAVMLKELLQLKRDRMTFAMVVMIPLIQLLLFGFAINTNIRDIPAAYVDHSHSSLAQVIVQSVQATQVVRFEKRFATAEEAEAALKRAEVRAVLILPRDLADRVARLASFSKTQPDGASRPTERPIGQWLVDGSDTMITGAVKGLRQFPLAELQGQSANQQVTTFAVTPFYNASQRTVVNTVPGLLGVILTMTMILFTSAAIVRERERGNLELLITTPISSLELMLAKIVPYVFIGALQVSIILALGYWVFGVAVAGSLWQLALMTLLFIAASLVLGLIISTIAKSQLQAMQLTVFVLLPSILLSGFMFPYEAMPKAAQTIAEALPATHYIRAIRAIILRQADVSDMQYDALWLMAFSALGLLIATQRFKKRLD
jgi:ABC-2 type transport system permease protein